MATCWLKKKNEALKSFLPSSIIKPHALFEFLIVNNRFKAYSNIFIALRICFKIPVTDASGERIFQN